MNSMVHVSINRINTRYEENVGRLHFAACRRNRSYLSLSLDFQFKMLDVLSKIRGK